MRKEFVPLFNQKARNRNRFVEFLSNEPHPFLFVHAELLTNTINFASQTSPTSTVRLACAGVLFKSPRARAMIQLGGREEK